MTGETAAELQARLGALAEAETPAAPEQAWGCDVEYVPREDHDDCIVPDYWTWEVHVGGEGLLGGAVIDDPTADLALIVALVNSWPAIAGMLARLAAAEAELALLKSEAQADADIAAGNFGMAGTIDDLRRLRELGKRA